MKNPGMRVMRDDGRWKRRRLLTARGAGGTLECMKLAVIIPAAGNSKRFGHADKLSQDLGGRRLLLRAVEAFVKREETTALIVAAPPEDVPGFKERFGPQLSFHGATIVEGGRTERWESVRNALSVVPEDITHVAVHDAARPLVTQTLLDRILDAARIHSAVIPGVAVSSTLKRIGDETVKAAMDDGIADAILGAPDADTGAPIARKVLETVSREGVVAIQTPQVFERELLERAYDHQNLAGATDDAMLVEKLGEPVVVVEGDPCNIKVTTQQDLDLARRLV
ncbi:MAG: 2-C-methyl-D-erythritol 4-phosphate cytidylyltransferase [Phycisphaerae bacterium]|nr:2-C-methyl-D-erythritol 4-phosphate cytidylyltransferase [Phycisphaerae bacterium]HAW95954.1 2-C-methyl-D-erythritol 4-phosphate cytidylyltransferase [Phycisphaerales bacterium]